MSNKLGYGLIGCGGCGTDKHLASYAAYPEDVKLIGVFDNDRKKAEAAAARFNQIRVYASCRELLADPDIDIVSVATPNRFHALISIAALKAGKHVHVEKPIAMSADEARRIVQAKNHYGKKVMVGLNNRFTETSFFLKRYMENGKLGKIYYARCGWLRRTGGNMRGTWFVDKSLSGGGPMIDLGVHYLDLTLYLLGYPAPLAVSGSCYDRIAKPSKDDLPYNTCMLGRGNKSGIFSVEDLAAGFVKLAGGATVSLEFSWASHIEKDTMFLELLGSRGGLSLRDGIIKIFRESAGETVDIRPNVNNSSGWGRNEARHFIACIREKKETMAPPEEAVKMMQIVDALYQSARTGCEVRFSRKK